MFQIFVFLSYYETIEYISTKNSLTTFPMLEYGFKKNAIISVNISKLSSPFLFGFATEKEIKKLKSLESGLQYCQGQTQIASYQFFIQEDSSINFLVHSKNILTPFFVLCENVVNCYTIFNFLNGNNRLDYRLQDLKTACLVFLVLYSVLSALIIIIFFLLYLRRLKIKCDLTQFFFLMAQAFFLLFIPVEMYIYFQFLSQNKNNEFINANNNYFLANIFPFIFLTAINIYFADGPQKLFNLKKSIFIHIIFVVSLLILIFIKFIPTINVFFTSTHILNSILYFIFFILNSALPRNLTLTRIAFLIYLIAGYFTYGLSFFFVFEMKIFSAGYMIYITVITSIIIDGICYILFSLDLFYFQSFIAFDKLLENQINKSEINYIDEKQRLTQVTVI